MITKFIRDIFSEKTDEFTFYSSTGEDLYLDKEAGLYIHIPFCKSMCSYCPYYKVFYNRELSQRFKSALISEIKEYSKKLKKRSFTSLYIGGGTPTLMINDLKIILKEIKHCFDLNGILAIETTPGDITRDKINILKDIGINYISLGVQSFQQKYLTLIGRNYTSDRALSAVKLLKDYDFDTFNIDLIFAYPGENSPELLKDLQTTISFSPDQITCYPLFTFPYSTIGKYKKIRKLKMPSYFVRRRMYYSIHCFLEEHGYKRSSVWSFNRKKTKPYSSVTRDYYIGFGPSAASYTGKGFYFNTFSVDEYIKAVKRRKPIALEMKVSKKMEKLFWLYWRLYETAVPIKRYKKLFKENIYTDFKMILRTIKAFGFVQSEDDGSIVLNKRGCLWIHLAQNYFALNYVSKIWSAFQKNPWPGRVEL